MHPSLYHSNKSRFFMFMKCAFFKWVSCSRYGFSNKNSRGRLFQNIVKTSCSFLISPKQIYELENKDKLLGNLIFSHLFIKNNVGNLIAAPLASGSCQTVIRKSLNCSIKRIYIKYSLSNFAQYLY